MPAESLTIRRRRRGRGWAYLNPQGRAIRSASTVDRLARLAVPPAYDDVRYAADPTAHLQATGRDAAGRLQYRYHPEWEKVREERKAQRLSRLVEILPRIRRRLGQHLGAWMPTREFACAAVIELIARTAIRPGCESYVRLHRTRGAATLLKSNVDVCGRRVRLSFRSKGGKVVIKEIVAPRLAKAVLLLQQLKGHRLFQYRLESGDVRPVSAQDVNRYLREIAKARISLKDFRTLSACTSVFGILAQTKPAETEHGRRRQVKEAVRVAADELANTPTICRRSYVHDTVVEAFEEGALEKFGDALKGKSPMRTAQALAQVVAARAE